MDDLQTSWRKRPRRRHNKEGISKKPRQDEVTTGESSSSEEEDRVKGFVTFRRDTHLSSAITITEIEYILTNKDNPQALKEEHRRMVAHVKGLELLHPRELFSWVLNNLDGIACKTDGPIKELGTILNIARQCTSVSTQDYTGNPVDLGVSSNTEMIRLYKAKVELDDIFEQVGNSRFYDLKYTWGKFSSYTSGNLHCISTGDGNKAFLVTHAHMAGVKDMVSGLFNTYVYSQVAENKYQSYSIYQELITLDRLVRDHSKRDPEGFYDVMKAWSSLTIASILRDTENNPSFMTTLLEGLSQQSTTPLLQHLIRKIESDEHALFRLEVSGLCKVYGHPIVYVRESASEWAKKGMFLKPGLEKMGRTLANMFKLEFSRNYFREMGQWPSMRTTIETPAKIKESHNSGRWDENPVSPWSPDDFDSITFEKTFEYDMFVDATDLLSDKSIIQDKESWGHEYDRKAYRTIYGKMIRLGPSPIKSAILSYLISEEVCVEDIIRTIESQKIPDSWKISRRGHQM